jgi:pyrroline-5-carboxylate reductase
LGTAIIDEKLMDAAATVLAASGTAFALRYIRSMQAGIEIDLIGKQRWLFLRKR